MKCNQGCKLSLEETLLTLLKDENTGIDRNYVMIGKERHDVGRPNDQGYPIRGLIRGDFLYLKNFNLNAGLQVILKQVI